MSISVLVVDDSETARLALRYALESDPEVRVVGEADTSATALRQIERLDPGIVTMDVFLRRENGIEVAAAIMERAPRPILIVTGGDAGDPGLIYRALQAGALDVCAKPPSLKHPAYGEHRQRIVRLVKTLAAVPVVRRQARRGPAAAVELERVAASRLQAPPAAEVKLLAIGASTGGPPVVSAVLKELGRRLPVPVVIVQHIAIGFTAGFAEWIEKETGVPFRVVDSNVSLEPGVAYLPTDGAHLVIGQDFRATRSDEAPRSHQKPSIDLLFASAAEHLVSRVVGVLLTGMGSDGAEGLLALKRAGACTIVQTPESCTVDSMPRRAIELGAATEILSPETIAAGIRRRLGSHPT